MPDQELTLEELEFMATALDGPMLAFKPLEDTTITGLLERNLMRLLPSSDPDHFSDRVDRRRQDLGVASATIRR